MPQGSRKPTVMPMSKPAEKGNVSAVWLQREAVSSLGACRNQTPYSR
jgi:hypothetical protein